MAIDIEELLALSREDKFHLMGLLWDSIDESEQIHLPEEGLREMLRRRDEMKRNPEVMVTHEEMWRRIRNR